MQTVLVLCILFGSTAVRAESTVDRFGNHKNPDKYQTDFSSDSVLKDDWSLSSGCMHCSHKEGTECTQETRNATKFGAAQDGKGFTFTTTQVPKTKCKACATSGHITWNKDILYGNFTVIAKWFPGSKDVVKTGEGYIDLEDEHNKNAITFGFAGLGEEGTDKFKTVIYAGGRDQVREYIQSPISLSKEFNEFGYSWSKSVVVWTLNGKVVRTIKEHIPTVPMTFRLHSRSNNCVDMKKGASFQSLYLSFRYDPP